MIIQRQSIELQPRTQRILELASSVLNGAEEVKSRIRRSVSDMQECGSLLLEEKEYVHKEFGPKAWESYFEATFSKTFSLRSAYGWIKLHRAKPQLSTNEGAIAPTIAPKEKPQLQVYPLTEDSPNDIRKGMLALDLFPPKKHVPTQEAGQDAPTPSVPAYSNLPLIAIVSRFCAWHSAFTNQYASTVTQEQASLLLKDLKPICTFIDQLRA